MALTVLAVPPVAPALDLTYPGASLSTDVFGNPNSLFPAASLAGNSVSVTGGMVGGNVFGGMTGSSANVMGNSVQISAGAVGGAVYGGYNRGGVTASNVVRILEGNIGGFVFGGDSDFNGGGVSINNRVEVAGGILSGGVVGGRAAFGAAGNFVDISGGKIAVVVAGGWTSVGDAVNNTIRLSGAPDLSASAIFGGVSFFSPNFIAGNTLIADGFRGSVGEINRFENYQFFLPASLGGGQTLITVLGGNPTALSDVNFSSNIRISGMEAGGEILKPGDSVVLISNVSGAPANIYASQVPKGVALLYDFDVSSAGGVLQATVRSVQPNPSANVLPNGRGAANVVVMHHYADLISGLAASRVLEPEERREGSSVYTVAAGGSYRLDVDSGIDIDGVSLLAGMDWRLPARFGNVTAGAFFEAGHGRYDSRTDFDGFGQVGGTGDVDYLGGGVLGFVGLPDGWYAEASARAGRVDTDFKSVTMHGLSGKNVNYDLSHAYYGAHGGLGYIRQATEKASLNLYSKYLWARQEGDEAVVLGDQIRFKAVDSHAWRTGARFSFAATAKLTPYVGGAFEYEFDGKAEADVDVFTLSAPGYRGGVGIGELGVTYKLGELFLDLGVKGYVGKREGVIGRFQVEYDF